MVPKILHHLELQVDDHVKNGLGGGVNGKSTKTTRVKVNNSRCYSSVLNHILRKTGDWCQLCAVLILRTRVIVTRTKAGSKQIN